MYKLGTYRVLSLRYKWNLFEWYCDRGYSLDSIETLFIQACQMGDTLFLNELFSRCDVEQFQILQVCLWTSNCKVVDDKKHCKIPKCSVRLLDTLWEYLNTEARGSFVISVYNEVNMGNTQTKDQFREKLENLVREHKDYIWN